MAEEKRAAPEMKPALAVCVGSEQEADRITAALQDAGVPASREYTGDVPGSRVLTGNTVENIRLFVPGDMEEKAVDILVGIGALQAPGEEQEPPPDEIAAGSEEKGTRGKSVVMTILLLLLIAAVVFSTDAVMEFFKRLFGGQ